MFRARLRMVCIPSASRSASPGTRPKTSFQYVEETTGICAMVKYLFMTSMLATLPARRATATAAAGLCAYMPWPL